jgi:hypothetical protein
MMHDWFGWLLLLFSFSIVLIWKSIREDTKVVHAIWFCLVLHHAAVFLNMYIPDAYTFHQSGVHLAALPEPKWFSIISNGAVNYIHFLGFFYRAFGASLFIGEELSVLAFVLSCVLLVKLVDHLDLRRFRVGIILLFGLLPSAVVFRSATLRESWQALFFLLSVYWTIRMWKRPGILKVSFLLMSVLCMSLLHYGLARYAVYLVAISVYWSVFGRKKNVRWSRRVRFLFAGLLVVCVIVLSQKMGWFMTLGEAVEGGAGMRQALLGYVDVRTNYSFILDTSSVLGLVKTIPMIFVEYMFAPFPWQVENVKDVCALLESILRFVLVFFALFSWRRSSGEVRSCYSFLLITVLGMELMWALGTANWGTAVRHHLPGYSVIVLLGVPGLILFMHRLQSGLFGRRKVSRFQDREKFIKTDPIINKI